MKKLYKDLTRSTTKRTYWFFECDCGIHVSLRSDTSAKHCSQPGCHLSHSIRHGKSESRLYSIWSGMRDRCINGCHASAVTYKKKGISICPEWSQYTVFEAWALSNGYADNLTIDRIDISKGYSPDNCEWVTRSENTRRQVTDGHSNQKPVRIYNDTLDLTFKSINEASEYIIMNGYSTSKPKSVSMMLSNILNHKRDSNYIYSFYIEEAK